MRRFLEKVEDLLAAIALAETEGTKTVRDIMEHSRIDRLGRIKVNIFNAITYAEAGDFETAQEFLAEQELHPLMPDECQFGDNDACYVEA